MQRRIAQVGIDQQHALAELGDVARQLHRARGLALARAGAGDEQRTRQAVRRRELQRRAHRAVRFGKRRARVGRRLQPA